MLISEGCNDGQTSVSNMAVMLADVQGPAVTEIYTTRDANPASSVFTQFHAGEDMYIHLKFDESIRFAEDEVTDEVIAMELNISMKRIVDQVELGGIYAKANLVSLINDTLTFKCTVPPSYTINGKQENTNFYLDKVDYKKQPAWINTNSVYDRKLVYKKSGDTEPTVIPISDKAKGNDIDKSTSLVVDLAGNGIDTIKSRTNFKYNCYMDNVAPSVKTVTIERILKNPVNSTDRGELFTTVGDKNGFWVIFDEDIILKSKNGNDYIPITDGNVGKFSAQLNIKDSSGNPIVVQGSKTDPGNRAKLYFEYTIQDGDKPLVYTAAGDQPIGVNRIYSNDSSYDLADSRGNRYNDNTELINREPGRILPEQELWLDVTPPTAAAGVEQNPDETYTPLPESAGSSEFYFPLIISDAGSEEYASGTNGLKGKFRWENEVHNPNRATYQFEYYIGGKTVPSNAIYRSASTWEDIPITQLDGDNGNVIHIRYKSGMDYSLGDTVLVVETVDYAGNTAEVRFPLAYAYDNIGPRIKLESYLNTFDSIYQTGKINARINIRDVEGKVSSIWYQLVDNDDTPSEDLWVEQEDYTTGDAGSKNFEFEKDDLDADVYYRYDLYIRTLNNNGTVTIESFHFDCDFRKPEYKIEFITDPEDILPKHSVISRSLIRRRPPQLP